MLTLFFFIGLIIQPVSATDYQTVVIHKEYTCNRYLPDGTCLEESYSLQRVPLRTTRNTLRTYSTTSQARIFHTGIPQKKLSADEIFVQQAQRNYQYRINEYTDGYDPREHLGRMNSHLPPYDRASRKKLMRM